MIKKKPVRRAVADKTRARILKAAHRLFAEYGFSATSTQKIAHAARVNENLIFHHFGNKAELWKKVKAELVEQISIEPLEEKPADLTTFLQSIIRQRVSAYQQHPALVRLLQWQRLESKQDRLAAAHVLAPHNWLAPLQYLQKVGHIKSDVNAEIISVWLLASINAVIFDNVPLLQSSANRQAYIQCLVSHFERALSP